MERGIHRHGRHFVASGVCACVRLCFCACVCVCVCVYVCMCLCVCVGEIYGLQLWYSVVASIMRSFSS